MHIRKATQKDIRRISYLIKKNTEKVLENNYTEAQVRVWKKANSPKAIKEHLHKRIIFCAFKNNVLLGTVGLQENEILGFYVSYAKRGMGIGGMLIRHVEQYARQHNWDVLELTSTPAGLPFYQKHGFVPQEEVIVVVGGVEFRETHMVKNL